MNFKQTLLISFSLMAIAVSSLAFTRRLEDPSDNPLQPPAHRHSDQVYNTVTDTAKYDQNVKRIADSLEKMNQRLPIEKIYLHTDKSLYSIGDTIWFKAYLVDHVFHLASNLSNVLFVELVDNDARLMDRISIRIKDGVGWGQIPLRKTQYQDGGYMLRAYTMWSQNFAFDFLFSQRFFIGTQVEDAWLVKSDVTVNLIDNQNRLQVSLFLNRMDKTSSPVAFKDVELKIYDDNHPVPKIYDEHRPVFIEEMRTDIDGHLKFTRTLKNGANGRRMTLSIMSLDPKDHNKIVLVPLLINRNNKIDLQFLPEGGKLVTGIKSVVGFKAIGEDGRGTRVSGEIFDSKGNKISDFISVHNGMGSIEITPMANEIYTARINDPKGIREDYRLPKPEPFGTVLHVDNPEKAADIKITLAGLSSIPAGDGFYVIGTSRGKIYYTQKIDTNQTELLVAKKSFPSGVARFTLFNGISPLNERIVFIDNQDQLHIQITPHKAHYGKRDSVSLAIEIKDKNGIPVQGNFSLSVTDDSQIKADSLGNYGIPAGLLINAELKGDYGINVLETFKKLKLKGEIESPGYYLNRTDSTAWEALDKLMLTEGWTDYKWAKVFSPDKPIFFNAQNNFDITGRVKNILNRPMANNVVLAFSQKPPFVKQTLTDKNGAFIFKDLLLIDSGSFFFQATRPNGKPLDIGEIEVDRPFDPYHVVDAYRYPISPWYVNSDTTQINRAKRISEQAKTDNPELTGTLLKEVEIKGKKVIRGSWNPYPADADYIFDEHDIKASGLNNLYDFLRQNIPGMRVEYSYERNEKTILTLTFNDRIIDTKIDGRPLQIDITKYDTGRIEELSKYQLANIRGIELIYSRKYTEWSRDMPRLIITTYNDKGGLKNFKGGNQAYRPLPITVPKVFYSPKYDIKPTVKLPDYRTTVHWEPNITTDENGKAMVSFYTSDAGSSLTLNIQGISVDGSIGNLLYKLL